MGIKKKILIIGSSGYLGMRLCKYLKNENLYLSSRKSNKSFIDLEKKEFPNIGKFDVIINCAGVSKIDICEKLNNKVDYINFLSSHDIMNEYSNDDTQLINISSSHVFDGSKERFNVSEARNPLNYYGYTKIKLEDITLNYKGSIVRAPKIVDNYFPRFADWYEKLRNNEQIIAASDLKVSLIHVNEFCELIKEIIKYGERGIEQISSNRSISYYDLAKNLAKNFEFNYDLIKPFKINEKTNNLYGENCSLHQTRIASLVNKKSNLEIFDNLKLN